LRSNRLADELRGDLVVLQPLAAAHYDALRAIVATPEVAAWWGPQDDDFPEDEPESTRFAIVADGAVVGLIQYGEELEPDFRHAWMDIFLDPAHHGRGLGTDALARLLRHLLEDRGHHRVTIDPAVDNKVAIRSYEKAGFEPVGVMRLSWRDPDGIWRDSLLMEHVRDPDPNRRE
jgi:aminoglycoside 6'-N-acetyltransferase